MDRPVHETVRQPFFIKVELAGIRQPCPNFWPNVMSY